MKDACAEVCGGSAAPPTLPVFGAAPIKAFILKSGCARESKVAQSVSSRIQMTSPVTRPPTRLISLVVLKYGDKCHHNSLKVLLASNLTQDQIICLQCFVLLTTPAVSHSSVMKHTCCRCNKVSPTPISVHLCLPGITKIKRDIVFAASLYL